MDIQRIQEALRRQKLDGWLFFDHHQRDPLAYRVLGFHPPRHVTRRWYYLVPAIGEPRGLVHRIEAGVIDALPGEKRKYSSWQEQHAGLAALLQGLTRVAMQYSPLCAVPYVAMVDAGTIELVRTQGVDVASSAELIQEFEACLSDEQFATHLEAGRRVDKVCAEAFRFIGEKLLNGVDELTVQAWIRDQFRIAGMITDSGPIVAVNAHAGNPHYEPTEQTNAPVIAAISSSSICGPSLTRQRRHTTTSPGRASVGLRRIVCEKSSKSFEMRGTGRSLPSQMRSKRSRDIRGFEVDDAARNHIREHGFGDRFVHRTGHSIGTEVHGTGANMDNLETHDERRILPGALFSIEPGIYLEDFGVRSEVNVFVTAQSAATTGAVQRELVRIG